jgi:exonuclease SbcD
VAGWTSSLPDYPEALQASAKRGQAFGPDPFSRLRPDKNSTLVTHPDELAPTVVTIPYMRPFRFIHAADLHIGSPFVGLRVEAGDEVADRLQGATYQAFDNLIDLCVEENVDFLLVAGDVYDGDNRLPRDQIYFWNGMRRLVQAGIQSFIVHGNHDHLGGRYSSMSWPDGVHVFEDPDMEPAWKVATRDDIPLADIRGVSYTRQHVDVNLAAKFGTARNSDLFSIGLLHCNVGEVEGHGNYAPCSIEELLDMGFDYWALGHIHKKQSLGRGNTLVEYPGNIQGRDVGELDEKGCLLVEVDSDGRAEIHFRPLDVIRWKVRDVPTAEITTLDGLLTELQGVVEELRSNSDGRDTIARLRLTGRSNLSRFIRDSGGLEMLAEELNPATFTSSQWVWIESIENLTRPPIDIEEMSKRDDFVGQLLNDAAKADPADFEEALAGVFSGRYAGRSGSLKPPDAAQINEWINEARWYLAEQFIDSESSER